MTKMILLHNSDRLFTSHKPPDNKTPFYYWYTDRFCSCFSWTNRYMYIFVIDPMNEKIRLRSRGNDWNFDTLHKNFLRYRNWCEGDLSGMYEESGIAMTFSEMKPTIILINKSYGSDSESWIETDFEIIEPFVSSHKRSVKLFQGENDRFYSTNPIRLTDIPELVALIPDMKDYLPFKEISPDKDGIYHYDNWLSMITETNGK